MSAPTTRHRLAEIGGLLADPARADILLALMDGSARPAGELGELAGVGAATASVHLRKLVEGGLLSVHAQGRHRYFHLAGEDVAQLIESLALASARNTAPGASMADRSLRRARTCYRHLAGQVGVAVFERLRERDALRLDSDALHLSLHGADWLHAIGLIDANDPIATLPGRSCVDWTERRFHLAGPLGTQLTQRLFDAGWLRRRRDARSRARLEGSRRLARTRHRLGPVAGTRLKRVRQLGWTRPQRTWKSQRTRRVLAGSPQARARSASTSAKGSMPVALR